MVDGHQVYASGQGNVKQGERFVLHPNVLRKLTIGELVVRVGSRRGVRPALVAVQRWQAAGTTPPAVADQTERPAPPEAAMQLDAAVDLTEPSPEEVGPDAEPEVEGWLVWDEDDTDLVEASPDREPTVG